MTRDHLFPRLTRSFVLLLITLPLLAACATDPAGRSRAEVAARAKIAQAKFEEHCKSAGEKIYRTADGVEGVFLLKLRQQGRNFSRQFDMDDPYGNDVNGEGYIETFLRGSSTPTNNPKMDWPKRLGYVFVEAEAYDGKRYRYTGEWKDVLITGTVGSGSYGKQWYSRNFVLDKTPATGAAPRYGVTYDDISTHEDREYWIAGSSLRVIDLQTNEVMAERIGYMWDPAQGNDSGGRSPWMAAADYACPDFHRYANAPYSNPGFSAQAHQTEDFVEKVLIPKVEK